MGRAGRRGRPRGGHEPFPALTRKPSSKLVGEVQGEFAKFSEPVFYPWRAYLAAILQSVPDPCEGLLFPSLLQATTILSFNSASWHRFVFDDRKP